MQAQEHRFLFNRRKGSFLHVQVGESKQQQSRELFFYCQKQIMCGLFFFLMVQILIFPNTNEKRDNQHNQCFPVSPQGKLVF